MLSKLYSFYEGKKVLVTGHNGFKGSWLTLWLQQMGARVVGVSLKTEKGGLWDQLGLKIEKEYVADIRNQGELYRIMAFENPDVVFHLAAQPLVRLSYDDPVMTYETNVMGTLNVLDAMRLLHIKNGVMITTDKCYENNNLGFPFRETDPFGGEDPYSSSKGCCEILINSMRKSYKELNMIKSARAGNVIGGGDYAKDRIVPDFFRALESDEILDLRNPSSTRPWQHVLEPLFGYLLLGMMDTTPGFGVNFGPYPNGAKDVATVIAHLNSACAKYKMGPVGVSYGQADANKPEANLLQLDITRAINKVGWKPVFSFEETIDKIARWYYILKNGLRGIMGEHDYDVTYGLGDIDTAKAFYACIRDIQDFEIKIIKEFGE